MAIRLKTLKNRKSDSRRTGKADDDTNALPDHAAEVARQMNVKTAGLNATIALLTTVCILLASLLIGVARVADGESDFYQTWTFSNYYNNILWTVASYADALACRDEGLDYDESDLASWQVDLNQNQRLYYRIRDLDSGKVLAVSSQYSRLRTNAIIYTTVESTQIETLYRTDEKRAVLADVRLYQSAIEKLSGHHLMIETGIAAYDDAVAGDDELHSSFVRYAFFNQFTPYLTWLVVVAFAAGILAIWLFGVLTRRMLQAPNRYKLSDLIPRDIALALLIADVLLAAVIFLDVLEPELMGAGNDIQRAGMMVLAFILLLCASVAVALSASLLCSLFEGTLITRSLIYRLFRGIGNGIGSLSRTFFGRGPIRRKLIGFIMFTGIIVGLNVMFALMQSVVLLWLIPVDLLIVWWVFRFALSLADIVENVLYAPQHDYDVTVESKTTMPLLLPFAERLGRMQEAVSEAVAEAVKGERLKTELLTNVSHDLKTPLTAVINYVKLLMQYPLEDENVKAYVAILDEKTQRLKTLVDDILEMSKLTSGNVRLSIETVDLEQVLTQALAEFENNLSQRGLMLMRRENEVPIYVEADSDKLWRVMENLLGNIAKYAQEGSRVYVVTTLQKHFVQLELKNISAEPLSQEGVYFTERFARGDQARGSEGSGLGLAIAKELVERMAGHFDVSVDGDLFKVTLVFERRTERSGGIGVQ